MYEAHDSRLAPAGHPVLAAVLTSLLTTVVAFAALTVADRRGLLDFLHAGARDAEVPSITGVTVDQARELLRARNLLLSLQAERPHPTIPAGQIAAQVPLAGSRAAPATAVQAFISSGPGAIVIPPLTGTRPDDAGEQLRNRRLVPGPRREEASTAIAAGLVIGTDPPAGKAVEAATSVALVVSSGPAARPVPKVLGLRLSKAKKVLEEAGFTLGSAKHGSSDDYDEDVIIRQEPAEKTAVAPGTAINVVVNEP
jgi:serine/threonine-protein kinase